MEKVDVVTKNRLHRFGFMIGLGFAWENNFFNNSIVPFCYNRTKLEIININYRKLCIICEASYLTPLNYERYKV